MEKESSSKDDGFNFDVDELVKKIDAKIAELEEEEKRNKAQEVSHQEIKPTPPIDNVKPLETTPVVENKTNVNNLELSDDESDDDFFDDFFDN